MHWGEHRTYRTVMALRRGEVVDLNGIKFKMDVDENGQEKEIRPGDIYIAERNTGPHLLTAAKVFRPGEGGFIQPTTFLDYFFDTGEGVKVIEAE